MGKKYFVRVILLGLLLASFFNKANAQYAQTGLANPKILKSIYWLTFGAINQGYDGNINNLPANGSTLVSVVPSNGGTYVGGSTPSGNNITSGNIVAGTYTWQFSPTVRIVGILSNLTTTVSGNDPNKISAYTPGYNTEDALDQLYNAANPFNNGSGILYSGIASPFAGTAKFDIALQVQILINGQYTSVAYPGMVIADAESMSSPSSGEYFSAQAPNLQFQILSKLWTGANSSDQSKAAEYTLNLSPALDQFTVSNTSYNGAVGANNGTSVVMFAKGSTGFKNVTLQGEGVTAVAIGFVIPFDLSDNPSSYGFPGNYIDHFSYPANTITTGGTYQIFGPNSSKAVADQNGAGQGAPTNPLSPQSVVYIGAQTVDADGQQLGNVYSSIDDSTGVYVSGTSGPVINDEDNFNTSNPKPTMKVNQSTDLTFSIPTITNNQSPSASANLYVWVDINNDGKYSPSEEQQVLNIPTGSGGPYTFTYPIGNFSNLKAGPIYARFRITTNSLSLGNVAATDNTNVDPRSQSYAQDGETEDYRFEVSGITISGTVFDDGSGYSDGISGTNSSAPTFQTLGTGQNTAQLYAYLLNGNNNIVNAVAVGSNGTYSFSGLSAGQYTVGITTTNPTIGSAGSTVTFTAPAGFSATGADYGTNNAGHAAGPFASPTLTVPVTTPGNSLNVTGVNFGINQGPTANADATTSPASTTVSIPVYSNDVDPDSPTSNPTLYLDKSSIRFTGSGASTDGLSYTDGTKGVYKVDPSNNGNVTFTASSTFTSGSSTAQYTIKDILGVVSNAATITVNYLNAPSTTADIIITTIGQPKSQDLRSNDANPNESVTSQTPTAKGGSTSTTNGVTTYNPPSATFTGKDAFTYTATDPSYTNTATQNVAVVVKPVGTADNATVAAGATTPVNITVTANDGPSVTAANNSGTTVTGLSTPTKGGTVTLGSGNTVNYTPPANGFAGNDTFTYMLTTADGVNSDPITVTVAVQPVGSPDTFNSTINAPLAQQPVAQNDASGNVQGIVVAPVGTTSTKSGTIASGNSGNVAYTTPNNFVGIDTYQYTLTTADGVSSSPITVTVKVAPKGQPDNASVAPGLTVNIPELANDGPSGTASGITITNTQPTQGTVTLNSDNTFTYTANANATGTDTFTYTITSSSASGSVASSPITVTITISSNGVPDNYSTPENTAYPSYNVKGNDGANYTAATVTITNSAGTTSGNSTQNTSQTANVTVNTDQSVSYTPPTGFVGIDNYYYTLTNGNTTNPPIKNTVNVKPVGTNDSYPINQNATAVPNNVKSNDLSGTIQGIILALGNTSPSHGQVQLSSDGNSFLYTPTTGYSGPDTYTYTLTSPAANGTVTSDQITVNITIQPAPTADTYNTNINTPIDYDVRNNDSSGIKTGTVNLPSSTTSKGGTVTNDGADKVIYTPPVNFTGNDTYTYTLTNNGSTTSPVTNTVSVLPVGINDIYATNPGVAIVNDVKSNDGASGNGATLAVATQPAHGSVAVTQGNPNTFTYTPATGYNGPADSYTYTLTSADGLAVSAPITVNISIVAAGTTTGNADADVTKINTPKATNVKANDGANFANATVTPSATSNKGGTVVNDGNGNLIYTPPTNFIGTDTYTYTLTNSGGTPSTPVTVTMAVKPVGMRDIYGTNVNTAVTNSVLDNDGPSAVNTTVSVVSQPAHGTITANTANTVFTYAPATGYVGTDTYTYKITTADGVSSDPITVIENIANSGTSGTLTTGGTPDMDVTNIGTPKTTNVRANDGSGNATATVTPQTGNTAKGGTVALASDGASITYTPAIGFTGVDTYTYTLTNGGTTTSPITVSINVRPVGANDNYFTTPGTPVANPVTTNDGASVTTTNGNTVVLVSPPSNGTVTPTSTSNNTGFQYAPLSGFNGTDSYTYAIVTPDGVYSAPITVTVTTAPASTVGQPDTYSTLINTPITYNVKGNDGANFAAATVNLPSATTTKGGTVTNSGDDKVIYTPPVNFTGKDTYTYTLTSNGTTTAAVTNTVSVIPVGVNDAYSTAVGVPVINDVKSNDGPSGNGTTLAVVTQPAHGTITGPNSANTAFLYTPTAGSTYTGTDSYTYTLTTTDGIVSAPITVNISIVAAGTTTGNPDADVTKINTPKATPVKANDGANFANATVTPSATSTNGGTVVNDGNGNLIYTPPTGFTGKDTYTYTLTQNSTTTPAVQVTMSVKPVGMRDIYGTNVNTAVLNDVKTNDGASATGTTIAVVTQPAHGTVALTSGSTTTFTYTPNTGYVGTDTYTYSLTTADGVVSDPITVIENIANSGTSGTLSTGGTPDMDVTNVGTPKTTNVRANDGTGNASATVTPQTGTTTNGGSVALASDGASITYIPKTGFTGKDTYTYTLTNNGTTTSPITVSINVRPVGVNDSYTTTTGNAVANPVTTNDGPSATGNTVVLVSPPAYGTVTANGNTAFTYTPATNFTGTDTYTYALVTPDGIYSAPITVINTVNTPGTTGQQDVYTTPVNTPITYDVKANDGATFSGATVNLPSATTTKGGTVTNSGDNKVIYTPPVNFTGRDGYTYTLTNNGTTTTPINVVVGVLPVGVNDVYSTAVGVPVINDVKSNDGPSGNGTTLSVATQPTNGTVAVTSGNTNTFTYTPNAGYSGNDSYTYILTTSDGVPSAPITVNISIVAAGTTTGNPDADVTKINTPKATPVKANDGANFANATVTPSATSTNGGTVVNDGNGNLIYTPPTGFTGKDTYTYTLTQNGTTTPAVQVTMSVKPVGMRDIYGTNVNTAVLNDVKTNDGASATGTTIAVVTQPAHGTVALTSGSTTTFTYTPNTGYVGTDTYTYSLTTADGVVSDPITVIENIANSGTSGTLSTGGTPDMDVTNVGTPKTTNVRANDGTGNASATVTPQTGTTTNGGSVALASDGASITYIPKTGFTGKDTYTYTLTNNGTTTSPITVSINVRPVGAKDNYTTAINTASTNTVKDNDGASASGTTVVLVSPPTYGTVTANGTNTAFTYNPANGYLGTDSYTYSLVTSDGVYSDPVTVTITIINPATTGNPDTDITTINTAKTTDVKANDGTAFANATVNPTTPTNKGGTTAVDNTGKVVYTPPTGFTGKDTYTYTLTNNGVTTAPILVTISVKPVGVNDSYTTPVSTPVVTDVKTNDGASATGTTVVAVTNPAHGTITPNNTNTNFTYTPATGYTGADSFTYALVTADGVQSDPITVNVTITSTATPDTDVTTINTAKTTDVKANDGTAFANATVTPTTPTTKGGTTAVDNTGKVVYTPATGFTGIDTYTYTLTSNGATTAPILVTINVKPVGVNDSYTTPVNTPVVTDVKTNDGASATGTTVVAVTNPAHGTITPNNTNTTFTYTPATGYTGADSFTYALVTADGVQSDPITVNITIVASGNPDTDITTINTAKTTDVKANDGTAFANATVNPTTPTTKGGTTAVDNTGKVVYTPPTGFTGKDTYTYTLTNNGVTTAPILVTISVKPVGTTDNYTTSINTPVITDVKTNDGASATGTTVVAVTSPAHGTITPNSSNTAFTYTPATGYTGTDSFTYALVTADGVQSDPITVNVGIASGSLTLTKAANNGASAAGDVINYTLVVTNTGTAAVTNVKVADSGADAGSISPANIAVLAPGASATVTAKHTVTAADVTAGSYSNQASVTATDAAGNPVSKPRSDNPSTPAVDDPTVVQILPKGSISLVKTGVSDYTSVTFTFTITNTGTITVNNLSLTDALLNITNSPITVAGGLAPGAKTTITFKYSLVQADRDAASVTNTATASGTDANNNTVTSTNTVNVTVPPAPKTNPENVSTQPGQPVTFNPTKNDQTSGAAFVAVEILVQPKHGKLIINADLSITYVPDPGYTGPDSFTYRLRDVNGFYTNASAVGISDGFVNNLRIPNTFSPNGDGVNDTFEILGIDAYPNNELIIINRWGNEVYHKTNYSKEWTGEGLNEGTYYFLLHLKNTDGSDLEVIKGYVTLIRNRVN